MSKPDAIRNQPAPAGFLLPTRTAVVAVARSFLETPYVHLGRTPGIELDCAGVVICAGRLTGSMPPDFDVEPYPQAADGHMLIDYCEKHLGPRVSQEDMQPGDVVVLQVTDQAQHMGILGDYVYGGLSIIHAFARHSQRHRGKVIETRLPDKGFAAAYAMPGVV